MRVEVQGQVAAGFEQVRTCFEQNWQGIEVGASYAVWHRGEQVVDLWGGYCDSASATPWQKDTLVNVYSTTKGLATVALAVLVDEGLLDYERQVIDYWPEFGAHGKDRVTVAQLLSHQAGVPTVDATLTIEDLYDWDKMVTLLAKQKPFWPPGTGSGYHSVTWGYLAGELVRRITGKTLGQYFREKVAIPLAADCYIGLPDREFDRVADLIGPNRARQQPAPAGTGTNLPELNALVFGNPIIRPYKDACSPAWRRAEIAASNGHANARGIARVYAAMANGGELEGVRILSPTAIAQAVQQEVGDEPDLVLGSPLRRSRGFILNTQQGYGPCARSFGHAGAGGSTGFADPENKLGIGYAMNQMHMDGLTMPRASLLIDSTYRCLGVNK
jgi:CubicO group peptidase (beta-lactamase class C family)